MLEPRPRLRVRVRVRRPLDGWIWIVALGIALGATGCPTRKPTRPPNVVIIVLDTARADFFSAYGYPRQTTPNIDGLAAAGVRFDHAYSTSNWTVPSHASLLTGRYPSELGMDWESPLLSDASETLAEILSRHGCASRAGIHNAWDTPCPRTHGTDA